MMIDTVELHESPGTGRAGRIAAASASVRETLAAIQKAGGPVSWCILTREEHRVRVALLHLYAEGGRAPDVAQLAARAGLSPQEMPPLLASLQRSAAIALDPDTGRVIAVYPFADHETDQRATLRTTTLNVVGATDALGVGSMYGEDVAIHSSCRACATPIEIATQDRGRSIASCRPETAVVWSGVRHEPGGAANSSRTVTAFFCCDAHLQNWRESQASALRGSRLSIDEALAAGRAIFGSTLRG